MNSVMYSISVATPLGRGIQRFTVISQEMVNGAPPLEEVLPRLEKMLRGRVLVRASGSEEMARLARVFEGNLTGTLYRAADGSDDPAWAVIAAALRPRVGRLIANKMPTGVAVSPAMNHGGPFPSTGHPGFTAVGMPAAIHRFAALHSYDGVPDALLPRELCDRNPGGVPRLVDGEWTTADVGTSP